MNEELVQRILERLLADSEFQQLLRQTSPKSKSACLVILNYVNDLPKLLAQIQKRWGREYSLAIMVSKSVNENQLLLPGEMTFVSPDEALSQTHWHKIVLPTCSANTLAKIALGIRDNALTEMVGHGLNLGIPIELYTEYLGFTEKTPQAYRQLYEGYVKQVESYGIEVYTSVREQFPRQTEPILKSPVKAPVPLAGSMTGNEEKPEFIQYNKKLLSDKDVYDFPIGSKVKVTAKTVISPLAKDSLKARKIELCPDVEEKFYDLSTSNW
ncbi:MAG: flavoprotein [Bacillota bacterium]|nr:flavoprotein [Bacillota bacterium]MDP4159127.1 flavoprotein [Bacillota bacterium]